MKSLLITFLLIPLFVVSCSNGDTKNANPPEDTPIKQSDTREQITNLDKEKTFSPAQLEPIEENPDLGNIDGGEIIEELTKASSSKLLDSSSSKGKNNLPQAATIAGADLDGNPLSLKDFAGKPLLVKVFSKH
tara:strand:+ start:175 stop:573 length:399 start_codon:yes stop_codon:yes gene_type:complete